MKVEKSIHWTESETSLSPPTPTRFWGYFLVIFSNMPIIRESFLFFVFGKFPHIYLLVKEFSSGGIMDEKKHLWLIPIYVYHYFNIILYNVKNKVITTK